MKPLATALFLLAVVAAVAARPAAADPFAHHLRTSSGSSATSIIVPAEWAGIWVTTDTVYTCAGAFVSTSSSTDTLCAGQVFDTDPSVNCTGSFDATSYTEHCTATGEVFTDCQYNITVDSHGTRTADSFYSVSTISTTYTGTGTGCDLLPPHCQQTNTHGTRTGPAPAAYCASPAEPSTWGKMKALYR